MNTTCIAEVRAALRAELDATPEFYDFRVVRSEPEGELWRVTIESGWAFTANGPANVVLDDAFDSARAWWGAPRKGGAAVLAVIAEDDQLVLKGATAPPPGAGLLIRLYPPRFLAPLANCWDDPGWAPLCAACLPALRAPARAGSATLSGEAFGWLRAAQRRALTLVHHASGFLWGPPGTGKTTTLGVLLAEYLHANPSARVLLLSTTNHAVDQATVAVDRALEHAGRHALRRTVKRLGSQFAASAYAGREHLLPVIDRDLLRRLSRAEADRPSPADLARFGAWKDTVADLRRRLRTQSLEVLRTARLASLTTTRASFELADLRRLPPYDLVVFDEASQIGLAQALAMMPLAPARIFAGDPEQLAPVVRSPAREAQRWLARSAFSEKPREGPSVCLLDEQSRMAAPISELVSSVFYDGALRVAADADADPRWRAVRARPFGRIGADEHVVIVEVARDGAWSPQHRGPVRPASAERVATLLAEAIGAGHARASEVIVLTPFRAQRALIRERLRERGLGDVKVSTVHRAQGSEAPFVVFDPVDGANPFLATGEARRLVNVALSRAQGKVVLVMSPADRDSPVLGRLWHRDRLRRENGAAVPIAQLLGLHDFPASAVGRIASIGRHVGEVCGTNRDGTELRLRNRETGAEQVFDVATLRRRFGPGAARP